MHIRMRNGKLVICLSHSKSYTCTLIIHHASINVSLDDDQSPKQISCRVKNADPKPTFNWYIGETRLETKPSSSESLTKDVKDDNNTWIQTLFYKPEVLHDNQTVRLH
mgnify:CR=1 FL=1